MALDRPDDDFARSEREVRGSDVPAARSDPAEWRGRGEYYEVLRVADGKPPGDSREDRSGWDAVDAADRPSPEDMRVSPERTTHILDGDEKGSGGGHRPGVGKPGKTEFPAGWNDKKIVDTVVDVARQPDSVLNISSWNDRWVCSGIRDSVEVSVYRSAQWSDLDRLAEEGSPGVIRNPPKETS